jgi:uncharacterized protein YbaP (TraB family)
VTSLPRAALIAMALAIAWAQAAAAKPPVWIVRTPTTTVVLFGSIHLLPPGLDWRPPALDDALAAADELWFEAPIDGETSSQADGAFKERGALPKGRRLTLMMSPMDAEHLRLVASKLDGAIDAIDRMQPWMADLTLSVAQDARDGGEASSGVEDEIQAIAPPTVVRRAFETARQQVGFLAGAPLKDQLASLNQTLWEIDNDPGAYQRVVAEWMSGDVGGLAKDALALLRQTSPTLYERQIAGRDRRWARILEKRLRKPGRVVVVVGVGHMVGPDGLPALLRAKGFQVDGP